MDKITISLDTLKDILSENNTDIESWKEVLNALPYVTAYSKREQYGDVMTVSQLLAVIFPVIPEEVKESDDSTQPEEVYGGLLRFFPDDNAEFRAAVSRNEFNTEHVQPGLRCSWKKATMLTLKHIRDNIIPARPRVRNK